MPLAAEVRVVRGERKIEAAIQLGEFEVRVPRQLLRDGDLRGISRQLDHEQPSLANGTCTSTVASYNLVDVGCQQARSRCHDHAAPNELAALVGADGFLRRGARPDRQRYC
jgi:hypothetical protein